MGSPNTRQPVLLPWTDKEFHQNPYPFYERVRREAPVYEDPISERTYVISRFEDVMTYGRLPSLTIKPPAWIPKGPWSFFKDSMIVKDPPEHAAIRRRSNKWFTPKLAKQWAEATTTAIDAALDDLGPSGMIEAYRNLALIPAHHAMCKALGLPNDGYDTASAFMHDAMIALGAAPTGEEEEKCEAAFNYLRDRVQHYINLRRKEPAEGMVSSWIDLVAQGEMTETQLFEGVLLFWATGTPNAAYLIAGGLETFAHHPDIYKLWREDPSQQQAILNEIARLHTPEVYFTRFTTEEINIRGVTIPPQSQIRFLIASANRDPEAFSNPHQFDLERPESQRRHLTFGIGAHSCPGMVISQAEAIAAFNLISERVKEIEMGGKPIYGQNDRAANYKRLPLRLVV